MPPKSAEPDMTTKSKKSENKFLERPLTYQSINNLDGIVSEGNEDYENQEGQLLCTERELPFSIEEEIKDGFFELKQKFREKGPTSIYISHNVLHAKHPLFKKAHIETLKKILLESSVVYLNKD